MRNNNLKFFFKSLLIKILLLKISCYIKFEIEIYNQNSITLLDNKFTILNLIKKELTNTMIVAIDIGTPSQKANLYLLMNEHIFYFSNKSEACYNQINYYSPFNSKSFQFFPNSTFENNTYTYTQLIQAKDIITFDFYSFVNKKEKQIKSFQKEIIFYINNNTNTNNNNHIKLIGSLGLGPNSNDIKNKNFQKIPSFLSQLKKYGLISNYRWFINLNENKNEIIFGLAPHEYDKNSFDEKLLINIPARPFKSRITHTEIFNWNFRITKMYAEFNKNKTFLDLTNEMSIELDYNCGLIVSIQKYWAYINEVLFKEYINNRKCFVNVTDNFYNNNEGFNHQYYYIYCNYEYKDEIRNNFRNIIIECQECNYTFVLNFDDLIKNIKIVNNEGIEENKYFLFLVVSHASDLSVHHYHRWVMGRPFLKKYQFFFEQNSKMIYFYKKENFNYSNNYNKNKKLINNTISSFNYRIVIIILLSILTLFIFFLFYRFLKIKKVKQNQTEKNKNDKFEMNDYKELIDK